VHSTKNDFIENYICSCAETLKTKNKLKCIYPFVFTGGRTESAVEI
jgi:hypothetical protein